MSVKPARGVPPPVREGDPAVLPFFQSDADFAAADADHDGQLTRDEAMVAARAFFAKAPKGTDEVDAARAYGRRFLLLDTDANGVLSKAEWDARDKASFTDRFKRFDANHDGTITLAEWRNVAKVVIPRSTPTDEDAIDVWALFFQF